MKPVMRPSILEIPKHPKAKLALKLKEPKVGAFDKKLPNFIFINSLTEQLSKLLK